MPEKAGTAKKATTTKAAPRKRVNKGESVVCEVCGLSVVVEEIGGVAVSEETTLLCCGKPMKTRKAPVRAKAAKASPAKTKAAKGKPAK